MLWDPDLGCFQLLRTLLLNGCLLTSEEGIDMTTHTPGWEFMGLVYRHSAGVLLLSVFM